MQICFINCSTVISYPTRLKVNILLDSKEILLWTFLNIEKKQDHFYFVKGIEYPPCTKHDFIALFMYL